jgi:SAM-dependent methyltransferase
MKSGLVARTLRRIAQIGAAPVLPGRSPAAEGIVTLRLPIRRRGGHCYFVDVRDFFGQGDVVGKPTDSRLFVFEDGNRIGRPHTPIGLIETEGNGDFSHWDGMLYFSASDNSDPNTNDHCYTAALSNAFYFGERYEYSRAQVAQLMTGLDLTPGDIRGKRLLEIGPGRDMGFALIMAGLGARTVGVEKYKPGWIEDWHVPFIDEICRRAPDDFSDFDPAPLRRCQRGNGLDPAWIEHWQTAMEDFPKDDSEGFDLTCSQAALEHVGQPEIVLRNLYQATKPAGSGLHVIDLRDHRDFAAPLEFLLLDETGFTAALAGQERHWFGNPLRLSAWQQLWRGAGFSDVQCTSAQPTVDEGYLRAFLPRLRGSRSHFRDTPEGDLRPLGAQFVLRR